MVLDRITILKTIEDIKMGIQTREDLKELLGGEILDNIFDQNTQNALLDSFINNGKIHSMNQGGTGLDTLEGLLNNQIRGDLSNFYMIKPDYILQLPLQEQKNMADSISSGNEDLSLALQKLWSQGIRTEACATRLSDNTPMVQLRVGLDEIENQNMIQQLYNQQAIEGRAFFDYEQKSFQINLSGENLYHYIQDIQAKQLEITAESKDDIFEGSIKDGLEFSEEIYKYYLESGANTTEIENQILVQKESLQYLKDREKRDNGLEQYNETINQQETLANKKSFFDRFKSKNIGNDSMTQIEQVPENDKTVKQNETKRPPWELDPEEKARIDERTSKVVTEFLQEQESKVQGNNIQQENPPIMDIDGLE